MTKLPQFQELRQLQFEPTRCPVCQAERFREKYSKKVQDYSMRYVSCLECGTLYTNPRLTVESLKNLYASELFFEGKEKNYNYYSFLSGEKYLTKTAASRLMRIMKYAKKGKLLEVASAAGFFLREAKKRGFDVTGIEISAPMAEYVTAQHGIKVFPKSIEEIELARHEYDVIASWGVFTILRDPRAVLRKFNQALKPGGCLALNTYYTGSLWERIFRQNWYILVANMSQIFSQQTLIQCIQESGFELVSRRRDCPYASIERLIFGLFSHFPGGVRNRLFEQLKFLNKIIIRVPLPDVYEYICVKKKEID
ncbi:class I SAM-dependent methyltransferase [Candidatus Omnitrophota bacterium]